MRKEKEGLLQGIILSALFPLFINFFEKDYFGVYINEYITPIKS